jgi:hypothetical protein
LISINAPACAGAHNNVQRCFEIRLSRARQVLMGSMSGLLILLAFAFGGAAACFYHAALDQVRPWFPPQFRNSYRANFALDGLIWERSFPAEARRNYLLSMEFTAAFCLCLAMVAYLERVFIFAIYALGLSLYTAGYVIVRWVKYQERL